MVHVINERTQESLTLPWELVRFPVELRVPSGFRPEALATWPSLVGRIEYVEGRLLYMPPCGGVQQEVTFDVAALLASWSGAHPEFAFGTNEAGMYLNGDVRAADVAVWRRSDIGPTTHELRQAPPVLAVEVAGRDDDEKALREKSRWYLDARVEVVWLVLPETREVVVITAERDSRFGVNDTLPPHPSLPGLSPSVREFFVQLGLGAKP